MTISLSLYGNTLTLQFSYENVVQNHPILPLLLVSSYVSDYIFPHGK